MAQPKWATPERQNQLVSIFLRSRGFCVFGHKACRIPQHYYEIYIEGLIADWVADDKAQRQAEWKEERKRLHSLAERRYPLRGQFSTISKDIFYAAQPQFYLLGLGISGLTFKPFAKVRLSSSYVYLYVDLTDSLSSVGKAKRRKAIRYGKPLPLELQGKINQVCKLAVEHYLEH
jgi:hypothetical protein